MSAFLLEVSYTPEAWAKQLANPVDRLNTIIKPMIEKAGGKLVCAYYAFGDNDVILIVEGIDEETMAGLAILVTSSGTLSHFRTTVLMDIASGVAAIKKGKSMAGSYTPVS